MRKERIYLFDGKTRVKLTWQTTRRQERACLPSRRHLCSTIPASVNFHVQRPERNIIFSHGMAKELSLADILVNRQAVSLARSQRVIQSWLPQRDPAEAAKANQQAADDSDFEPESEIAGVGSKRKAEDDEGVLGGLKRKRVAANDRLLEQLLGKKGAQSARKGQEGSKGPAHTAAKPLVATKKEAKTADDSDDEDEGRAASFTSRKRKAVPPPTADEPEADSPDQAKLASAPTASAPPPAKRLKSNSYLDELLGQKAAKKQSKKKKKKKPVEGET